MKSYKLAIASDHAGYELKEFLIGYLLSAGHAVEDCGCFSVESVDYPDLAHKLASEIEQSKAELGIALCGSANGITMTLNRHPKIRAAICWKKEIAQLARAHNDANVCSLPARFIEKEDAAEIVDMFLETEFEGGRHARRIAKI